MTTDDNHDCKTAKEALETLSDRIPLLKNAIDSSLGPNPPSEQSSPNSKPNGQTQAQSPGTNTNGFRKDLLLLDEDHHPMIARMAARAEWFARELKSDSRNPVSIAFSGSSGCGKTHTARRLYKFSQSYGPDILFLKRLYHWSSLWLDWPRVAESDDEDDFREVLYQIRETTMLVIDDLGAESDRFKNGVSGSRLRRILSEIEDRWVVITCNGSLAEVLNAYDVRIADRLRTFHWLEMGDVPSYRPKLKDKI